MYSLLISLCLLIVQCCAVSHPWVGEPRSDQFGPLWQVLHQQMIIQTVANKNDLRVIFFGDSITMGWNQNGKYVWDKYYKPRHAYNYGIGGDKTEHLIWRMANGEFDGLDSKLVVLKIGTNNLESNNATDIAKGIREVVDQILRRQPKARVLLLGIIPREGKLETKVQAINAIIAKYNDSKRVFYLDLSSHFQTAPGVQIKDLYLTDKIHLTAKGYEVWHDLMEPLFSKLYNMS